MSAEEPPVTASSSVDNSSAANVHLLPPRTSNAGRKRRSCLTCSKRKVKCDKQKPCHNCAKIGSECIFPRVAPSRNQFPSTPEVVEMLQRLEKVVETLKPREHEKAEDVQNQKRRTGADDEEQKSPAPPANADNAVEMTGVESFEQHEQVEEENQEPAWSDTIAPDIQSGYKGQGKIIRDQGRDIYVRRWFWDDGDDEDTSDFMTDDEDFTDPDDGPHPVSAGLGGLWSEDVNNGANIQTQSFAAKTIQLSSEQRFQLWAIYKERVDPVVKTFHVPTLEQAFLESHERNPPDGMECVFLAIYYSAITSLTHDECMGMFRKSQACMLGRIRGALEIMFSEAMLIHTGDIRPLNALILYLASLRHHDPRRSWNLSGLAVRLAQSFGLHREGSLFGLSKFDMEMRRRLWWHIAVLDAPSAEDYSGEYTLLEMGSFDTQQPRNLDDMQLHPGLSEYPMETLGFTEMTFTLLRCEITNVYRCMIDSRRTCGNTGKKYANLTQQEFSDWIDYCEMQFFDRYLCDCNIANDFHWMTGILTRMLFNKVRLHGCNSLRDIEAVSEEHRERLFIVAVEVIELNYQLRTDPRTRPWCWLFSSYYQWHALSLVLVWLQANPLGKNSRRAWKAVEKAMVLRWEHPSPLSNGGKPQQWRSVTRMLEKARSIRREALSKRNRRGSRHLSTGNSVGLPQGVVPMTDSVEAGKSVNQPAQPSSSCQGSAQQHNLLRHNTSNLVTSSAPLGNIAVPAISGPEPNITLEPPDGLDGLDGFPEFMMDDIPDIQSFANWMSMDLDLSNSDLPSVPRFE